MTMNKRSNIYIGGQPMKVTSKDLYDKLKIIEGKVRAYQRVIDSMISSNAVDNYIITSTLALSSDDIIESLYDILEDNTNNK